MDRSERIRERQKFNSAGAVTYVDVYKENGERDSIPLPVFHLTSGDTLDRGDIATFEGRVLNVLDTTYTAGLLVITSQFDTLNNGLFKATDTLAVLENGIEGYQYKFRAVKSGRGMIYGIIAFRKEDDESIYVQELNIVHSYFVK